MSPGIPALAAPAAGDDLSNLFKWMLSPGESPAKAAAPTKPTRSRDDSLQFELFDVFGRKVSSADYAGVPLFLEFGACW
jgi:hypothetical protein